MKQLTSLTSLALADITTVVETSLTGLSPESARMYRSRITSYRDWSGDTLTREVVKRYLRHLESMGRSPQVRNQALAAIKRLTDECAELGYLPHEVAVQVARIKSAKVHGIRTGRWLTTAQASDLLEATQNSTIRVNNIIGKRDAAVIALLLGCGLRRNEVVNLKLNQISVSGGRTILRNLLGKGGRTRSVTVPYWAAQMIDEWMAQIEPQNNWFDKPLVRSVLSCGTINGSLSTAAVRIIVQHYGEQIGIPDLNPHDLRRTYARLARNGGAPLETIQESLGHSSIRTTELYLKTGLEANAGDYINIETEKRT